ncbi:MAG: class I SAM-dependent methyltransferase, partial [Acidimicrobiia bacterium]|nr:class I SAM-dependent methyltransferase [Acidimicrobiia bacterium]
ALERRYTPTEAADEYRCGECGLQYFSPLNQGGPDFYDALASSDRYYRGERWEYPLALLAISGPVRVLDIGCGRGDFLVQARAEGHAVMGAETNPDAHPFLDDRSIEWYAGDIAELDQTFDLVCSFQVLEHLESVATLMEPAIDRLAPGGVIFASVPNRQRLDAHPRLEPLDSPPHHVSRWSPAQFDVLAERHGLVVRAVHRQRKSLRAAAKVMVQRTVGRSRSVPGGPTWRGVVRRAPLANTMAVELVRP